MTLPPATTFPSPPMSHLRRCALFAVLILSGTLLATDWSRFRGPNGTGVADPATPTRFALTTDLAWMTELPGIGNGSPIVVGDKVFLQAASKDGSSRSLVCLNVSDGKVAWEKKLTGKTATIHKKSSLASCTPCSDGERVFHVVWDGTGLTMLAYDLKGNELWQKGLGSFASQHGFGHSPIVVGGLVIFNYDQDGAAELVAFDAKTGERAWRVERKPHRASYTTPFVVEKDGKPVELIVASTTTIDSYDPKTGKVNWTFTVPWDNPNKKLRAIGQPVMADGNVVMATGDGDGSRTLVAVKAGGKGELGKDALAWKVTKETPYVPGVLVYENHLYWVGDDGQASCADPKTGKVKWCERLPGIKGVSSSPILIGDTVFVVGEDGKAVSFKADPKELGNVEKSDVGEPVFATPAAAGGKLFIRGGTHLFCIGKK